MPFTNNDYLPTYEELTIPELEITSVVFRAAAHHMGKYCDHVSKEFMLCNAEEKDPRKCINEGKEVTRCGFEFLGLLKKSCLAEFNQYVNCVDHAYGGNMDITKCRTTQAVLDQCVLDNLGQERPQLGHFCKVRLHDTCRPRPEKKYHLLPERVQKPPPEPAPPSDPSKNPRLL